MSRLAKNGRDTRDTGTVKYISVCWERKNLSRDIFGNGTPGHFLNRVPLENVCVPMQNGTSGQNGTEKVLDNSLKYKRVSRCPDSPVKKTAGRSIFRIQYDKRGDAEALVTGRKQEAGQEVHAAYHLSEGRTDDRSGYAGLLEILCELSGRLRKVPGVHF